MRFFRFKKLVNMETSKYLRYAVGEVVLVVIGILIALQVNNWNEYRKEKVEEKKILLSLHNEISNNLESLQVVIEEKNKIINVNDVSYMILGKVSADTEYSNEELKAQYSLADTILRNGNELYICMKIIDAEYEMI